MPKWIIEDAPQIQAPIALQQEEIPESFGQRAKRVATSTGIGALENLENIATFLPRLLLGKEPPHPTPVQQIKQSYGLTPEYLAPRNTLESTIKRFGSQAPAAGLIGGGLGLQALGLGTAAATVPTALGYPESTQNLTQLAVELPFAIGRGIQKGRNQTIKSAQKSEYELAKSSIGKAAPEGKLEKNIQNLSGVGKWPIITKVNAKEIKNALSKVSTQLETEVNEKYATKIRNAFEVIEKNITAEKIEPKAALELRKSLYKLGKELPADKAKQYIQPLTEGMNNFFASYAAQNPTFYEHLKAADKLTQLRHMNTYLEGLVGKLDLHKIPFGRAIQDVVNFGLRNTEKFARGLATNSAARKYYFDATKSIIKNNYHLAGRRMQKVEQELDLKDFAQSTPKVKWIIE